MDLSPPVRIAHAFGDRRQALLQALDAAVDVVEADIWYGGSNIWVRHERRLPFLPILADAWRSAHHGAGAWAFAIAPRYYVRPDIHKLSLKEVLQTALGKRRLLLDVKGGYQRGQHRAFAAAIAGHILEHSRWQEVAVCGQNWRVLDRLRELAPHLEVRYSMESPRQWAQYVEMAGLQEGLKRICMERKLLSEDKARFLEENGIDVYCWTVDDLEEAQRLVARGVDGIISNSLELLASLHPTLPLAAGEANARDVSPDAGVI